MKWKVSIYEYERGWGTRVDEVRVFDTDSEAKQFSDDYNKDNHLNKDDWGMWASEPYKA